MKKFEKTLLFLIIVICTAGMFAGNIKVSAATKAKVVLEFTDGTKQTWKTGDKKISLGKKKLAYIYFGSFPQTKVTNKKTLAKLITAKYDKDDTTTINGVRFLRVPKVDMGHLTPVGDIPEEVAKGAMDGYIPGINSLYWDSGFPTFNHQSKTLSFLEMPGIKKEYVYFKYEPIKWRVLSLSKGKAYLLSEYCIDQKPMNRDDFDIVWDDCDLRRWCNDNFLNIAFDSKEQKLIVNSKLKNERNPVFDVDGGEDTVDKIFLPSFSDMLNKKYGFSSEFCEDMFFYDVNYNRLASATEYAIAQGCIVDYLHLTSEGQPSVPYLLRTIGNCNDVASSVNNDSILLCYSTQEFVRPALNLNLKNIIE